MSSVRRRETWDPAWDDGTDASGFSWAQRIYTGLTAANLNAFLYWWGSTTPTENGDNEGLLLMNTSTGTVTPSGRLWAFANYSRFVRPGAVRIGASSANSDLEVLAFRNTDGSTAVVVLPPRPRRARPSRRAGPAPSRFPT